MRHPIDATAMTLVAMAAPEPVVDFTTGQPKADPRGRPLFTVQVAAMFDGQGEVLAVKVAGEPTGIGAGVPVSVEGLVAQPWELDGRSGIAWRANAIRPATTAGGDKGGERAARATAS